MINEILTQEAGGMLAGIYRMSPEMTVLGVVVTLAGLAFLLVIAYKMNKKD